MAVPEQRHPRHDADAPPRGSRRGPARTPARPSRGDGSFAVRARVSVSPWTDDVFAHDVREVMRTVSLSEEIVLGTGTGAVLAERLLRERGYQRARVIDARTADEAMRRVAHWRVLRDGEGPSAAG